MGTDSQTLTYDAAGRIINATETDAPEIRNYTYDALDRLISERDNNTERQWTYDANGNRLFEQSGANITTYTQDGNSNRLLAVAGSTQATYQYDPAGNTLTDGQRNYRWNAAGRLNAVVMGGQTVLTSRYNGLGERTVKVNT